MQQFTNEQLEELLKAVEEAGRQDLADRIRNEQQWRKAVMKKLEADHFADMVQTAIFTDPKPQYAVIAAVDQLGGYAKDGKIPWHFSEDFKWFRLRTENHVCIMGRKTYDDINERLKNEQSVLPNRKCFVVSRTLSELPNATVVKYITDVEMHLETENLEQKRFIIGGGELFREGIGLSNEVYLTIINEDYQCDQFFPTQFVLSNFKKAKMYKAKGNPEQLRFVVFKRNDHEQSAHTVVEG